MRHPSRGLRTRGRTRHSPGSGSPAPSGDRSGRSRPAPGRRPTRGFRPRPGRRPTAPPGPSGPALPTAGPLWSGGTTIRMPFPPTGRGRPRCPGRTPTPSVSRPARSAGSTPARCRARPPGTRCRRRPESTDRTHHRWPCPRGHARPRRCTGPGSRPRESCSCRTTRRTARSGPWRTRTGRLPGAQSGWPGLRPTGRCPARCTGRIRPPRPDPLRPGATPPRPKGLPERLPKTAWTCPRAPLPAPAPP